ncbi:MAG: hypothetical protein LBN34_02940 [Clostridiales Family XIII bacterium]|jgi:hypothetical protein|nr:hypothetical protein [Clostridiales Family XIII bacterium]
MDAIREIVNGNALSSIIKLPKSLRDKQVEVIILPINEEVSDTEIKVSRDILRQMKKNATVTKLTGAISHEPITIAEIREERLVDKYGSIDR